MRRRILFSLTVILFAAVRVSGQDDYNARARKYVEQYYKLAMAEQKRCGIPASVTLGQGILETEAGISELMTEANNHFGIKCKNGWEGETYLHTDDAPNECFKKYRCAADSYRDHSDHLKRNQRYAPLFKLSETDYASWAKCLKKCGYATNPQYAQKLIKIIEDFRLQEYTYAALENNDINPNNSFDNNNNFKVIPAVYSSPMQEDTTRKIVEVPDTPRAKPQAEVSAIKQIADSARNIIVHNEEPAAAPLPAAEKKDTSEVMMVNGLKAFRAKKGELLAPYAQKYVISHPFLLEINDLRNAPLPCDMYIYLERKHTTGSQATHTVAEGETMLMVAQQEGIQLRSLCAFNKLSLNEEPVTGTILELQKPANEKPGVKPKEIPAHTRNAILMKDDSAGKQANGYIATRAGATTAPVKEILVAEKLDTPVEAQSSTPQLVKIDEPVQTVIKPVLKSPSEMTYEEVQAESTKKAELAKLKAELDKIVYADDSKLALQMNAPVISERKPVAEPTAAKTDKYYTVKKGDTAFSIAKKNNITVEQLYKLNNIAAGDVKTGKTLQVKE